MSIGAAVLVAWGFMSLVMLALWLLQRRGTNAGIVDVAWSFGTGACAAWLAFHADGLPVRRLMVGAMAGMWGVRLGLMLAGRMRHEREDGRYTMMRQRWGDRAQWRMLGFYQIQAVWAVLFALPMMGAAFSSRPLGAPDVLGVLVWAASVLGETVADRQLAQFRLQPENRGRVCRIGLWGWSRHPNYFFEWLHWFAYALVGLGSGWVWLSAAGICIMLLFLTKITGIPPTEARAVQSRGDAYRAYQREVSAFFPLPPKRTSA
jgi:steroid 5-alpha reductase family enzyme